MSSTNLAICFAPSLLEPDYSLAVIKNEAPTLVEFMIRRAMDIYNKELPELFRQASESEREMGPTCIQYVKVKDDDTSGGGTLSSNGSRKYHHQRNLSMESTCTSASEESEDELSGYPHLSQVDGTSTLLSTSSHGQVSILSEGISTGAEGDMSDNEDDEGGAYTVDKWLPITTRQVMGNRMRHHRNGDAVSRRRSYVVQPLASKHYSPDLASSSILGAGGATGGGISPLNRSRGSSHGSGSPMFPHRVDHLDPERGGVRNEPSNGSSSGSGGSNRKKRRKPGHSNSFSKPSDLPHIETRLPQSTSFSCSNDYDSLLPADNRPRSHTVAATVSRPLPVSLGRDALTSSIEIGSLSSGGGTGRVSSAGMTRSGGWTQPQGKTSSSGTRRSGSPDALGELANTPFTKVNSELIKQSISNRFNLTTTSGPSGPADKRTNPSSLPVKEDIKSSRLGSDASNNSKTAPTITNKYAAYQQQSSLSSSSTANQKEMKRVESIDSTTASIDDRPEAERHLNSLPRSQTSTGSLGRRGVFGPAEMMPLGYNNQTESGSQLTIGSGGYSSDTESSPSRTLNRPDKLLEVATGSPYTIPSRYSKYSTAGSDQQNSSSSLKNMDSFDRPPSIDEHSLQNHSHEEPSDPPRHSNTGAYTTRESYNKRSSLTSQSATSKTRGGGASWQQQQLDIADDTKRNFASSLQETPPTSSPDSFVTLSSSMASRSFEEKTGPLPVPHIGTRQLGSSLASHQHRSRSMPGERNVTRRSLGSRGPPGGSVPHVKTERVVRYELPVPKKIRRINLRAYNTAK